MSFKSSGARKRAPPPPPVPPTDGKTEVLLRFFESEHFDEWVAISNLWRTNNDGVVDYLCNRLLSLSDERVERYLNQIITLQILRPNKSLERAIVRACARSIRLGTQTCWLLAAAAGDRVPGPTEALRDDAISRARGEWRLPFAAMSPMLDHRFAWTMAVARIRGSGRRQGSPRTRRRLLRGAGVAVARRRGVAQVSVSGGGAGRRTHWMTQSQKRRPQRGHVCVHPETRGDLCGCPRSQRGVRPGAGRRARAQRAPDALIEGHAPGAGVMFPMGETHARVVRIPASEAVLLNSREKAPYLLCLEVIAAPGEEWSHDGSPVSRRTRSTPRHSRESSDSLPLHDMSAPLWSTHDFLSGANGSGGHDPAERGRPARRRPQLATSGPLHPLNAAGGAPRRRAGG